MGCVGDQAFTRVYPCGVQSTNDKCVGDNQAGKQLAERKKIVAAAGSKFANSGQSAQEILQLADVGVESRGQSSRALFSKQRFSGIAVTLAQCFE